MISLDVLICHKCDQWERPPALKPKCKSDPLGRTFEELANIHLCPNGYFPNRLIGSIITWSFKRSGLKWLHHQIKYSIFWLLRLFDLIPPEFKVPYTCKSCVLAQEWLDQQHKKWKDRWKRKQKYKALTKQRKLNAIR